MSRWIYHFTWNPLTLILAVLVAICTQFFADSLVHTDGVGAAVMLLALLPFGVVGFATHFHSVIRSITRHAVLSVDERNRIHRIGQLKRTTYIIVMFFNIAVGTSLVLAVLIQGPDAVTARIWIGAIVFAIISIAISVVEKSYLADFQGDLDDRQTALDRQRALDTELHDYPRNPTL